MGKSIIIRIPIVPGYTDSAKNIELTAAFLSGLKSVERVDLIGYHGFGMVKYTQLGKDYELHDVQLPSEEQLKDISQAFNASGLRVQIGG